MLKIFPSSGSSELFRGWLESFPALEKTVQACMLSRVWLFCDPMVCSPPGYSVLEIFQARILWLPFPPPGDLPNPGTEPRSPALQADCLPSEPPGNSLIGVYIFQTYQIVYAKYVQLCVCQSYLNKLIFFFLKKKVTYWDILSPRAGQLLFLSISPKVWVGHAGLFCPNVVHSRLWAHSQLSEGDLGRAFCSLWAAGSRLPTGTCLPAIVVQLLSLCGHVSDFVSNSFPSAYRNVSTSDTGSHDNPGPQFARHLLHGSIVPIHREPIP